MFDFWREGLELVVKRNCSRMFTIWEESGKVGKSETKNLRLTNEYRMWNVWFYQHVQINERLFYFTTIQTVLQTRANENVSCKNVKCKTKVENTHTHTCMHLGFSYSSVVAIKLTHTTHNTQRRALNVCLVKSKEWIPMHIHWCQLLKFIFPLNNCCAEWRKLSNAK